MKVKPEMQEYWDKNVADIAKAPDFGVEDMRNPEYKGVGFPRSYYQGILDVAEEIGNLLDKGKEPSVAYEQATKGRDLTGYMVGWSARLVSQCSVHGEKFRQWWNAKHGQDSAKGTVNPAIIEIRPKTDEDLR